MPYPVMFFSFPRIFAPLLFDLVCLQSDAEKIYKMLKSNPMDQHCGLSFMRCGLCGGTAKAFKILSSEPESVNGRRELREKVFNFMYLLYLCFALGSSIILMQLSHVDM